MEKAQNSSAAVPPPARGTERAATPPPRRAESRPLIDSGQASAPAPVSATKVETPPAKERMVSLSELDIQRYVAPRFPRGAVYRDVTGYVDVFIDSAEEAISRWRFARRDDEVAAQVRLSFDLEE